MKQLPLMGKSGYLLKKEILQQAKKMFCKHV